MVLALTAALHDSNSWMMVTRPSRAAKCRGVSLLKEQEMRSKYKRHNKCILINNAVVGAILFVSHVDGGVTRQQKLDDGNATFKSGVV